MQPPPLVLYITTPLHGCQGISPKIITPPVPRPRSLRGLAGCGGRPLLRQAPGRGAGPAKGPEAPENGGLVLPKSPACPNGRLKRSPSEDASEPIEPTREPTYFCTNEMQHEHGIDARGEMRASATGVEAGLECVTTTAGSRGGGYNFGPL